MLRVLYFDTNLKRLKKRTEFLNQQNLSVIAVDHIQLVLEILYAGALEIVLLGEDIKNEQVDFIVDILKHHLYSAPKLIKLKDSDSKQLEVHYPTYIEFVELDSFVAYTTSQTSL